MKHRYAFLCLAALLAALSPFAFGQNQIELTPVKDNTLYESTSGDISNGSGPHFYVGRTNRGDRRRALLAFDVAGNLPAEARIQSVTLVLQLSNEPPGAGPSAVSLHRVEADWGEGSSNAGSPGGTGTFAAAGDATWLYRFFNTDRWTNPGGDFDDTPSATTSVDNPGTYTWTSERMAGDVQDWLERPDENFGWILIGDELNNGSARRFDSRESTTPPTLTITFSTATATEAETVPADFRLEQNFPNPFHRATTITFALPAGGPVRLRVYDLLGHEIATLVDGFRAAGTHTVDFVADGWPAGLYLYRLEAGGRTRTRTMALLK
ncbi:DNRLRE domain-containing protein [Rhodocaloribacter litoris]|uniref:DNRLRE domain-containing protein n=1 Tax=Rhodocaloribacter litoris TaxID=2558931 RepID=UPI00141EC8B0|nr:DNRLRE domain-containing protein [Rhodocaloribacter litoris]QXD14276.1 DNRLRE domain-containing protein [Rhodocaloribacter litoris]